MTIRPSQLVRKGSLTSRASTAVPASDPDLQVRLAKGVTYQLDIKLLVDINGTVPGFQCTLDLTNFDGTISSIHQMVFEDRTNGGVIKGDTNNGAIWGGFHTIIIPAGTNASYKMFIQGQYGVSADTLVALQWSQLVSDAATVILGVGSSMLATPLT